MPARNILVCVCTFFVLCKSVHACDCGVCVLGSVKGIVSKWQSGSRETDSYVCGLITINSPFDCN